MQQYAPGVDRDDPMLSPARASREALAGMPLTRIVIGEYDPLKDEGVAFAQLLSDAGVEVEAIEVPGLIHHAVMAPKLLPRGRELVRDTAQAIGAALHGDGTS